MRLHHYIPATAFALLPFLSTLPAHAQTDGKLVTDPSDPAYVGMRFESADTPFDQLCAKAEAEGKLLFMDCYTQWCVPCKNMAKNVFPTKVMGDYMNSRYLSVKMDMEAGQGIELCDRYDVNAFPTYLLLDGKGQVKGRFSANMAPEHFIAALEKCLSPQGVMALVSRYEAGERSEAFVREYMQQLAANYMSGTRAKVVREMIKGKSVDDLLADSVLYADFCSVTEDPHDPLFLQMYARSADFVQRYGEKHAPTVQKIWSSYAYRSLTFSGHTCTAFDESFLNDYVAFMRQHHVPNIDSIVSAVKEYADKIEK